MTVDLINALTKLFHELGPWAGVVTSALAGYWAYRAKEHGKAVAVKQEVVIAKLDENTAKTDKVSVKADEVSAQVAKVEIAVNGRVDQLTEAAKLEGKREAESELRQQNIGRP